MVSGVSICLLWFVSASVAVIKKNTHSCFSWHGLHVFVCAYVWLFLLDQEMFVFIVCFGPFSMRSTLLSHSEWAKRAASGLERRPRQNGAGATPQWNRTGDHHKGKTPAVSTPDNRSHFLLPSRNLGKSAN